MMEYIGAIIAVATPILIIIFIILGRAITMYFNGTAETNKLLKETNRLLTQIIREGKDGKN